jgi:Nucleosome-binding factor SPN, POB3 subunit
MQIKKDMTDSVKVKLTPEQISAQFDDKLKEEYEGEVYDIVAKVFKAIVKVNIVIPGDFQRYTEYSLSSILALRSTVVSSVPLEPQKDTCSS